MKTPLKSHSLRLDVCLLPKLKVFQQANIGYRMVCGWGQHMSIFYINFSSISFFTLGIYTWNKHLWFAGNPEPYQMFKPLSKQQWRGGKCTDARNGPGTVTELVTTADHLKSTCHLSQRLTYSTAYLFGPLMKKGVEVQVTQKRILHKVTLWGGQWVLNAIWKPALF